jgi:hypothetical protein
MSEHPEKLAVGYYSVNLDHCVILQNTSIFTRRLGCIDFTIREAVESDFHPSSVDWGGFSISKSWKPTIHALKLQGEANSNEKGISFHIRALIRTSSRCLIPCFYSS